MAASTAEIRTLEQKFIDVGMSPTRARTLAEKAANGDPREATRVLFRSTIREISTDAITEIDRVKSVRQRSIAFGNIVRRILEDNGAVPNKTRARSNLEGLGLTSDYVDWAVNDRVPLTPTHVLYATQEEIRQGKDARRARIDGLNMAIEDAVITKAMRGEVERLGFVLTVAAIIAIVAIVVSVLVAAVQLIVHFVERAQTEEAMREYNRSLQEQPMIAEELQAMLAAMAQKSTWEEAKRVALTYIANYRNGRSSFLEGEEEELKAQWEEIRGIAREEERRQAQVIREGEQAVADIATAQQRASLFQAAGVVVQRSRQAKTTRTALMIGIPVLGVGAVAGVAAYVTKK